MIFRIDADTWLVAVGKFKDPEREGRRCLAIAGVRQYDLLPPSQHPDEYQRCVNIAMTQGQEFFTKVKITDPHKGEALGDGTKHLFLRVFRS